LAIVGFSWGGWVTGGTARQMAHNQANIDVVSALVPICLEQSKLDPNVAVKLAELKGANSYERANMLMKTGWATMPGSDTANRGVATMCMDRLEDTF
jgi:hypothetical protein